ncbi:MAG: NAD(+)/NADH kinase [Dehalococcoidia bacterium]
MKKLGIFAHPQSAAAGALAEEIVRVIRADGIQSWVSSPWDDRTIVENLPDTEMLVCIGGDGTVLSGARSVLPRAVPILGVNMGRLGFLCELAPRETIERLPQILLGRYRVERLTMLKTELPASGDAPAVELHALNDVNIGRGAIARPVQVTLSIEGVRIVRVRADGMIISTATGSTGYNLSAGGPILAPASRAIIVVAVAPHLSLVRPLVLEDESALAVTVEADHGAILSVDGQVNRPLPSGTTIRVQRSPYEAHLVRLDAPAHFYSRLNHYLDSAARG